MTDSDPVGDFWATTLSELEHSERYHLRRINFWRGVYVVTRLWAIVPIVGVASSGAKPLLDASSHGWLLAVGSSLLALGLIDFPREWVQKRLRLHDSLRKDFLRAQRALEEGRMLAGDAKARLTSKALADKLQIELQEPDHLQVLQAACQNELWVKAGHDEESSGYTKIGPLQRLFLHFFDWRPHRLFNNRQRRAARRFRRQIRRARLNSILRRS